MDTLVKRVIDAIGEVLLGKDNQVRLATACLFAGGHLLIEDLPGMGKTTLAHCLAKVFGLQYERIQFTSDLMPADILGVSVFDRDQSVFRFHQGPIFTQVLLADEINRSTPKTQSALLEAMEEGQVSIEGETRQLPSPFFVIATQNPTSQHGTFQLPESQLDRFLMRISLGYPNSASERLLFKGVDPRQRLSEMSGVVSTEQLIQIREAVSKIRTTDPLLDYLQRLVDFTRNNDRFIHGLSPRGALSWLKSAKSWAFIHGRDFVTPDDLQAVMGAVVAHRIKSPEEHSSDKREILDFILENVDVLSDCA